MSYPIETTLYRAPALRWTARRLLKALVLLPFRLIQLPFKLLLSHLILLALLPARAFRKSKATPGIRYVQSLSGAKLATYDIASRNPYNAATPGIRHILYFNPNMGIAEDADDRMQAMANQTGCHVTVFNYSSVATSSRPNLWHHLFPSFDVLVQDGLSQVFRLLQEKNLELDQIELHGWSLGGAVSTAVAHTLQHLCAHPEEAPKALRAKFAQGREPYLFNDRSFKSVFGVVWGWVGITGTPKSVLGWLLSPLHLVFSLVIAPIVKGLLVLTGLETHAGFHYSQYPKEKRNHVLIRPSKADRRGVSNPTDGWVKSPAPEDLVIRHYGSLDQSWFLKWQRIAERKQVCQGVSDPIEAKLLWKHQRNKHKFVTPTSTVLARFAHQMPPSDCTQRATGSFDDFDMESVHSSWVLRSRRP